MTNNEDMRLQKFLARCGIASRRACEQLILDGKISINDKVVTKMGTKVDPNTDVVKYDGKIIKAKNDDFTIMLNKPAGYVSTMNDPQGRPCVASLIPLDAHPSLFPVGRLDRLTSGMLIFSTDGDLGQRLLHPKNEVTKKYSAVIDGQLKENSEAINTLRTGVEILGGKTAPAKVEIVETFHFDKYQELENEFFKNCASAKDQACLPNNKQLLNKKFSEVNIEIHEGKNRQVRRMFEAVGFCVLLLCRKSIGKLKLGSLECGKWAKLNDEEINLMLD